MGHSPRREQAVGTAGLAETLEASIGRLKDKVPPGPGAPALVRLETALRTVALDRRLSPRFPCAVRVAISSAAGTCETLTFDVSQRGLMLDRPPDFEAVVGETLHLAIEAVGALTGTLVALDEDTMSVRIEEAGDRAATPQEMSPELALAVGTAERYRQMVGELAVANALGIDAASRLAAEVASVFQNGLDHGHIAGEMLFSTQHAPLSGTDPLQFDHPALEFHRRALPEVLARHHDIDRRMAYAIVVDIAGYAPVHNKRYSQPQRPSDPAFNRKFARSQRIYADRWTMKAARFARGPLVQTVRRDVPRGHGRKAREFACPIIVAGRRWGAALIGFALD